MEGEELERKKGIGELKEIIQTIVAMLNRKGGRIEVGVRDDGKVLGAETWWIDKIIDEARSAIEPRYSPTVRVEERDGKKVLVIEVEEGMNKPYSAYGRVFVRRGSRTVKATPDDLKAILVERGVGLDSALVGSLEDLDRKLIERFVEEGKAKGRLPPEAEPTLSLLKKLGLVKDRPTLAAILLFSSFPQRYLPYGSVRIAVMGGASHEVLSDEMIEGPLVEQLEKGVERILFSLPKRLVVEGLRSGNELAVPPEAVREALLNALIHRDYTVPQFVTVRIYPDRMVVRNPGGLLPQLEVEDLYREHDSYPRNPLIATVLYRWGYLEQWGRGTLVIKESMERAGGRVEFVDEGRAFSVVFHYSSAFSLNERQRALLKRKGRGEIVERREYEKLFGVSERTARRDLEELVELGYLRREGHGRKARYVVERSLKSSL